MSKRHTHMPGWVSNGPVQINVGRDLHIHGGGCGPAFEPDASSSPTHSSSDGEGLWLILKVIGVAVLVPIALAGGALLLCFLIAFLLGGLALDLGIWTLCRGTTGVAICLLRVESAIGGGPKKLVFTPNLWGAARSIGPGNNVRELDALAVRETEYVDSN